jgi:hypothetical protein
MKAKLGAMAILVLGMTAAFAQEDYSTWPNNKVITVNTASGGANLTAGVGNYPLLLRLNTTNFPALGTAGTRASIRFARGAKKLPYQIESWDSTGTSGALVWVSVDTVLASNAVQNIQVFWGKAGTADSSNGSAVFARNKGFVTVHHMGAPTGLSGSPYAARPNAVQPGTNDARFYPKPNDSVSVSGTISRAGVIGLADTLRGNGNSSFLTTTTAINGRGDHFAFAFPGYAQGQPLPAGTFAELGGAGISLWIRAAENATTWSHFFTTGYRDASGGNPTDVGNPFYQVALFRSQNDAGNLAAGVHASNTNEANVIAVGVVALDQWQHVAMTINEFDLFVYLNGEVVAEGFSGTLSGEERNLGFIGRSLWNADVAWRGLVDEPRLHNRARSVQWYKLDYETQRPTGSNVVAFGAAIAAPTGITYVPDSLIAPAGAAITPRSPQGAAVSTVTKFAISAPLPAGLSFDTLTGRISGTPTAQTATQTYTITATNQAGTGTATIRVGVGPTGIRAANGTASESFVRMNGRNATFRLPEVESGASLRISVTDMSGRTVWGRSVASGVREISWNGMSSQGAQVRGIHVVRVTSEAAGRTKTVAESKITLGQ